MNRKLAIEKAKLYVARKCGQGDACACTNAKRIFAAANISIMAGSLAELNFEDDGDHPNQLPFKGVLLLLDQASTKPPHGSRGHRIFVPTDVAKKCLGGLRGMAINYDPEDLDSHQTRNKIGIITDCGITGNKVWVKGIIWKKDFPEAATKLQGRRDLGMSMELANVYVRDEHEDVWHLEDFDFTGATILKKSAAAYYSTELAATSDRTATALAANAAAASGKTCKGEVMKRQASKTVAAASNSGQAALLVDALKGALGVAIAPLVTEIRASNERQSALANPLEELKGLHFINASAQDVDEDEDEQDIAAASEEEDDDMAAAKKDNQADDEADNEDDEEGEDDDLSAELEDLEEDAPDEEPGEVNKDAKNKGDKKTVTDPPTQGEKFGGGVAGKRLKSAAKPFPGLKSSAGIQAAAVMVDTMKAQMGRMRKQYKASVASLQAAAAKQGKEMKALRTKVATMEAQVERAAEVITRRSNALAPEIRNLLAKANADPREIQAGAADKLTVGAVDNVFNMLASEGVGIEPVKRAEYKNRLVELGLMENGEERWAN